MISNAIQRLKITVSGINRETLTLFMMQWKGRGVELLTKLSTQMHESPFKACSALVIANGLFYGIASRYVVNYLDNCCDPSGKGQNNRWAGVVVLGTCTALFNLGLSKLTQFQLSRVALLAITSLVIALRLIFKTDITSSHGQLVVAVKRDRGYQPLRNSGYAESDLVTFAQQVNVPDALSRFNAFLTTASQQGKALPTTVLEKRQLLLDVASAFADNRDRLPTSGSSSDPLQVVFGEIGQNLPNTSLLSTVRVDEHYQSLSGVGFTAFQLASLVTVVGEEHCNTVMETTDGFMQAIHGKSSSRCFIQTEDRRHSLLQSMINTFSLIKDESTNPVTNFNAVIKICKRRLNKKTYQELIVKRGCSQEQIDSLMYLYVADRPDFRRCLCPIYPKGRIKSFDEYIIPYLGTNPQENRQKIDRVLTVFKQLIRLNADSDDKLKNSDIFYCSCTLSLVKDSLINNGITNFQIESLIQACLGSTLNKKELEIEFSKTISILCIHFLREEILKSSDYVADFIKSTEKRNSLLQSIIKSIHLARTRSSNIQENAPRDMLRKIIELYQSRLENERYQDLLARGCTQEQIDSILHVCDEKITGFHVVDQRLILRTLQEGLTPLLGTDPQENRQIIAAIVIKFSQSVRSKQGLDDMQMCFRNICSSFSCREYLRDAGFTDVQLAILVDAVGEDNRHVAIVQFYELFQLFQNSPTPGLIQNEEQRNSLLQSIIRSINLAKLRSPAMNDISPILENVFKLYRSRLNNEKYQDLLERGCTPEQIDSILHVCAEKINDFGNYEQNRMLQILQESLTPLLGADPQANRAIVTANVTEFSESARSEKDGIHHILMCFQNVCSDFERRKFLRDAGFTDVQLTNLFRIVGGDNRETTVHFYSFIQQLQKDSPTPASNLIQNEGQRNALLQSIIRSFVSIRSRSDKFPFKDIFYIYEKRLKSEDYYAVLERGCPQELIDSLMDIYAERDNTYFGLYGQKIILERVAEHLTPRLCADHKENSALVAGILAECRKKLGENPELSDYKTKALVDKICSEFVSQNQPQSSSSAGSSKK